MRRCGPDTSEQPSGRRVGWAGGCSYLGEFKGSNVIVLNKVCQRPISRLIIACPGPSETMPPKSTTATGLPYTRSAASIQVRNLPSSSSTPSSSLRDARENSLSPL